MAMQKRWMCCALKSGTQFPYPTADKKARTSTRDRVLRAVFFLMAGCVNLVLGQGGH